MTVPYGLWWFEAEPTDDGNAQIAVVQRTFEALPNTLLPLLGISERAIVLACLTLIILRQNLDARPAVMAESAVNRPSSP